MKFRLTPPVVLTAVAAAMLLPADSSAADARRRYRLLRAGTSSSMQHAPGPFLTGPRTCTPDVDETVLALLPPDQRTTTEVFGETFDPAKFDEISVAGDGRIIAYATSVSDAGIPGTSKEIVIVPVTPRGEPVRVPKVAGENDQPSIQFDEFGYRCAFRSSSAAGGAAPSNIQLYSHKRAGTTPETETIPVTEVSGTTVSFDPALAARIRVREIVGGVKVRERDARVAFVSTGNLTGSNPANRPQLFLWEEADDVMRQLTHHDDAEASVNRPAIAKTGDVVVFESTADLDPASVDPLDSSRVGNPGHVRQLFRWRRGLGVDQITWSDGDCFSPRMEINGRFVVFSSRGDPISGANPEGNLEIFQWTPRAQPALRLRQLTQTAEGDNVLPRPTLRPGSFAFYSTSHPPLPDDPSEPVSDTNPRRAFGEGRHECTPQALYYDRGRVVHVHGYLDSQQVLRAIGPPSKLPVITGPPAPGVYGTKFFFATNDFRFNARPEDPDEPRDTTTQLFTFTVAVAVRR
jgi:hypothetical protein